MKTVLKIVFRNITLNEFLNSKLMTFTDFCVDLLI